MHKLGMLWAAHHDTVRLRRHQRIRARERSGIENIPDNLFVENFRLDKETFGKLCEELRAQTNLRGSSQIPLRTKVLCALSFFATGSYQRIVGLSKNLPQRTASRCIRQVVDALTHPSIINKWIQFPCTPQERSSVKEEFQRKFGLPGVIGCIDCTHIAIVKPDDEEHLFFNRKGYHSLNVQMTCNHNLEITSVNSKFGGATHDAHIWSASAVEAHMRGLHLTGERVWLLGDSGYPQRPWLMTPISNAAPGSREETYTTRHVQARALIERCFGLLKIRWRCLLKDRTLHYHPSVASKITLACCVLHNIALNARLPTPSDIPADDHSGGDFGGPSTFIDSDQTEVISGRAMQDYLLSRL